RPQKESLLNKVTWSTKATVVAVGLAVLTTIGSNSALQAQPKNFLPLLLASNTHKPFLLRAETPEGGSPGLNSSSAHSEASYSFLGLRPSPAQVYQLPRLRNFPVATKEHQGINEVSILVSPSPTDPAVNYLYSAYMPYNPNVANSSLIKVAKLELRSSLADST